MCVVRVCLLCLFCVVSVPYGKAWRRRKFFVCFCVFICYRFRGLNQFEEGRIVTKYVFRIACSVRVCTENINLVRSLFAALCFCFVSLRFRFRILFSSYIRFRLFTSIGFDSRRSYILVISFRRTLAYSFRTLSLRTFSFRTLSFRTLSFRSKCHFKVRNLNPPLLRLQQQAANRSLDQILLLRCPYINLQNLHLSHLSPMSRYHR